MLIETNKKFFFFEILLKISENKSRIKNQSQILRFYSLILTKYYFSLFDNMFLKIIIKMLNLILILRFQKTDLKIDSGNYCIAKSCDSICNTLARGVPSAVELGGDPPFARFWSEWRPGGVTPRETIQLAGGRSGFDATVAKLVPARFPLTTTRLQTRSYSHSRIFSADR